MQAEKNFAAQAKADIEARTDADRRADAEPREVAALKILPKLGSCPFSLFFDVHQGYRVLTNSHVSAAVLFDNHLGPPAIGARPLTFLLVGRVPLQK